MDVRFDTVSTSAEDTYTAEYRDIVADGTTVGSVSLMIDAEYTYCERIDVDEQYRNCGIGTAALQSLSSEFGGIVVAPDNEDALRLYERIGSEWSHSDAAYIDQGFGVYEI